MPVNYIQLLGLAAGFCTTIAFLPQVIKIWKMKEARDLSLTTFMIFFIGVILWLIYGLYINDIVIIISNAITIVLAAIILFFKFRFG